jgi:hypothetical protein
MDSSLISACFLSDEIHDHIMELFGTKENVKIFCDRTPALSTFENDSSGKHLLKLLYLNFKIF